MDVEEGDGLALTYHQIRMELPPPVRSHDLDLPIQVFRVFRPSHDPLAQYNLYSELVQGIHHCGVSPNLSYNSWAGSQSQPALTGCVDRLRVQRHQARPGVEKGDVFVGINLFQVGCEFCDQLKSMAGKGGTEEDRDRR